MIVLTSIQGQEGIIPPPGNRVLQKRFRVDKISSGVRILNIYIKASFVGFGMVG